MSHDDKNEIIHFYINIEHKKRPLNLGFLACYRPPHADNIPSFFNSLNSYVAADHDTVDELIVVGDLNFNLLSHSESKDLMDFNSQHGFHNTVTKATRYHKPTGNSTLLDVIMCFIISYLVQSFVFNYFNSDHCLIVSSFKFNSSKHVSNKIMSRCINDKLYTSIKLRINEYFSHTDLSRLDDVNVLWAEIKKGIIYCLDMTAPMKSMTIRSDKNLPWFDSALSNLGKKRNRLYNIARAEFKKFKSSFSSLSSLSSDHHVKLAWSAFSLIREKFNALFRKKKAEYYKNFIDENSVSSTKLWQKLGPLINPNKKTLINVTDIASVGCLNPKQNAVDTFSNYFSSITNSFNFLDLSVCLDYITKSFENPRIKISNFSFPEISSDEVFKQLSLLDSKSAPGFVGIDTIIFKDHSEELGFVLADLFNKCLANGTVPDEWKVSYITPVYKKGSKSNISNYRPISVLSPIAKVFEALVGVRIKDYFESNDIFTPTQFGFRQNCSCELALNTIIDIMEIQT